jgi:hypothetical protein
VRFAWLLPTIAAMAILLQAVLLAEFRILDTSTVVRFVVLDSLLLALVLCLFFALRRRKPISLPLALLGFCVLPPLSEWLLHPGASLVLAPCAFLMTAVAWAQHGSPSVEAGVRRVLAVVLLGGVAVWSTLIIRGIEHVDGNAVHHIVYAAGLIIAVSLYILYVARHVRDFVQLSDGMFLLGCFVVLPAMYIGPFEILDGRKNILPCFLVGFYYGVFAFFVMAMAWALRKKQEPEDAHDLEILDTEEPPSSHRPGAIPS